MIPAVADRVAGRARPDARTDTSVIEALPPVGTTGAEMTVGVHWLRGIAFGKPVEDVLSALSGRWGESVVVLDHGRSGYSDGYICGHAKVYAHPDRPDMGVMVEVEGEGCDALGLLEVASIHSLLELRASRFDIAVDHCPFTPETVRDAWRAGDVRSRSKIPDDAREDRPWRTSKWVEESTGDMFTMGARSSSQYVRCYDRRGFTRFELELKADAAALAAQQLLEVAAGDDPASFALEALGWVRRFVDFVDLDSSIHASRRDLLPWWAEFIEAAAVARVTLGATVVRTLEQVVGWVDHQAGPSLALIIEALGVDELLRIARAGRQRWRTRHRAVLSGVSRDSLPSMS